MNGGYYPGRCTCCETMATIAEMRIPATDLALEPTFEQLPTLECELEQVVAADHIGLWLSGPDHEELATALTDDWTVNSYEHTTTADDQWLYTVDFADAVTEVLSIPIDEGGTILAASATNRTWTFRIRFPSRDCVSQAYDGLEAADVTVDLTRLHDLTEETAPELGLTAEQYETLVAAIKHGYFEIPRKTSMQDLATELDVSHQALSERLRRAYRTLVTTELDVHEDSHAEQVEG